MIIWAYQLTTFLQLFLAEKCKCLLLLSNLDLCGWPSPRTNLKRPILKYTHNRASNPLEIIGFYPSLSFLPIHTHSYPLQAIAVHTFLQLSYNFLKPTFRAFLTFQKVLRNSSPTFSTIITSKLIHFIALQKQLARYSHVHFSGET